MVIGVLQFEVLIPDSSSLKDKRRVVRSLKDRLHREHQVSVAEVAMLDSHTTAILGLACVGSDGRRVSQVLDSITSKLRGMRDGRLGETARELIRGTGGAGGDDPRSEEPASP